MGNKKDYLVIYLTKDRKEIKRDFNPYYIPNKGSKVNFKETSSNLMPHQLNENYNIIDLIYAVDSCLEIIVDL